MALSLVAGSYTDILSNSKCILMKEIYLRHAHGITPFSTLGLLKKRNKDIEKAALSVIAKSPESLIFFFFFFQKEK